MEEHLGKSDLELMLRYESGRRYKLRRVWKDYSEPIEVKAKLYTLNEDEKWDCFEAFDATESGPDDLKPQGDLVAQAQSVIHGIFNEPKANLQSVREL